MKSMKWLSVLLSISLGANFWFLWRGYHAESDPIPYNNRSLINTNDTEVLKSNKGNNDPQHHSLQSTSSSDYASSTHQQIQLEKDFRTDRRSYLSHLQSLAQEQQFEALEYEVSAYLRLFPQDMDAIMLEAQAYYHNKPLNTALVHYQELLSQPLSPQYSAQIEKLIAVNTTRIIQQFSGDGAWDLLAKFLEPLVQVDPRNRGYLMALAHSYGMQQQFTLMEDVLANFPSNDTRANRLRTEILTRLEQQGLTSDDEPKVAIATPNTHLTEDRVADVMLQQTRGHFMTEARVRNTVVNLLVDTGASTTAISDLKFDSISADEVEFLGLFNVNTAGGVIEAPIYKIKQFVIGQRTLDNISVLVLPNENLSIYDGLLGMNVLSQFDLAYDAASQTMRMYKKG